MKALLMSVSIIILCILFACAHSDNEIILSFTGDILLSRGVGEKVSEEGYDYPYSSVKSIFQSDDYTIGNLESPITVQEKSVCKSKEILFKADVENAASLKKAGYEMLVLANNHAMDYYAKGLEETMINLENASLEYVGAGSDYDQAHRLKIVKLKNSTFGFKAYSVFPPEGYANSHVTPQISIYDKAKIESEIKEAKKSCDFLIVSIHWGNEYEKYPSEHQKKMAQDIIDAGADAIIGHHPHVLQSIEKYKDKYIFYSLGNFVFDRQIQSGTDQTVILRLHYRDKSNVEWEVIPVVISDCRPRPALEEDGQKIVKELQRISGEDIVIEKKNGIWLLQ
jgi:poly-gamma-glutamate synthesis protein (capsule biosynthesis protein)